MNPGQLAKAIALFFKQTPAQRDATAQMRAALPVEQGGLGLPPDNEFYDRVNVMFPKTVYRGMDRPEVLDDFIDHPQHYPRAGNSYRGDSSVFTAPSELVARTYGPTTKFRLNDEGFGSVNFGGTNYMGLDFDHTDPRSFPDYALEHLRMYGETPEHAQFLTLSDMADDVTLYDANNQALGVIGRGSTDKVADVVSDFDHIYEHGERLAPDGNFLETYEELPDVDLPGVRIDNIIDINDGRMGMSAADKLKVVQPSTVYVSKPNRLRRATANFDPFLKEWDHIFAGSGAVGVGILLDQTPTDEQKQGALYVQ